MKQLQTILVFALVFISLNVNAQKATSIAKDSLGIEILKIINNTNWDYYFYDESKNRRTYAYDKQPKLASKVLMENDSLIFNFGKKGVKFINLVENKLEQDETHSISNNYRDEYELFYLSLVHPWRTTKNSDLEYKQGKAEVKKLYDLLIEYKNVHISIAIAKELEEFKIQYKKHLEMSEQPTVSEEQRKFIVQANAQNEEKSYANALELYKKVIKVNQFSYPSAYYNMALISAQIRDYNYAIFNMKKYLILEPNAPDARAAQDKIYEWEVKIN